MSDRELEIREFELSIDDPKVRMPRGAKILLAFRDDRGAIILRARVNPGSPSEEHRFKIENSAGGFAVSYVSGDAL